MSNNSGQSGRTTLHPTHQTAPRYDRFLPVVLIPVLGARGPCENVLLHGLKTGRTNPCGRANETEFPPLLGLVALMLLLLGLAAVLFDSLFLLTSHFASDSAEAVLSYLFALEQTLPNR